MIRGSLRRAFRVSPSCKGARAGVDDFVRLGAGKVGSEGYIEGEVDLMSRHCRVWRHGIGAADRALSRRWNGHFMLVWPTKAHGRSHLLPAMSGLACEVGNLVHLERVDASHADSVSSVRRGRIRRKSRSLEPRHAQTRRSTTPVPLQLQGREDSWRAMNAGVFLMVVNSAWHR